MHRTVSRRTFLVDFGVAPYRDASNFSRRLRGENALRYLAYALLIVIVAVISTLIATVLHSLA